MAVQAPPVKPTVPNKNEKPSEELKGSPELSDGSQEVFEENFPAVAIKTEDAAVNGAEAVRSFATSTPVTSNVSETSSSAWKPYRQSPQSMGACTSAMTTSVSSSVAVVSSQATESRVTSTRRDGDGAASYKPFHLQESLGSQVQSQPINNKVGDSKGLASASSQDSWETKVFQQFQWSLCTFCLKCLRVPCKPRFSLKPSLIYPLLKLTRQFYIETL